MVTISLLGWLSDSNSSSSSSSSSSGEDKIRDESKKHRRAHTEPAIGKPPNSSDIKSGSRVSV